MNGPLLEVKGLTFSYGGGPGRPGDPVLADVDFTLNSGEILGIIGPNGSGKSTLIRILSGVLSPFAGYLWVGGHAAASLDRRALARLVAVVPQIPTLPEGFTVGEIVLLGRTPHLRLLQAEGRNDLAITRHAMELTDTWKLADRLVNELSGGERQRVVIARALAQEPSALLLDEPTAHLDLSHQVAILDLVAKLTQEQGLGVLAVFHDLNLAAQYCHRVMMLDGGRVFAEGLPTEVINVRNIKAVYHTEVDVVPHPHNGLPVALVARSNGLGHRAAT